MVPYDDNFIFIKNWRATLAKTLEIHYENHSNNISSWTISQNQKKTNQWFSKETEHSILGPSLLVTY